MSQNKNVKDVTTYFLSNKNWKWSQCWWFVSSSDSKFGFIHGLGESLGKSLPMTGTGKSDYYSDSCTRSLSKVSQNARDRDQKWVRMLKIFYFYFFLTECNFLNRALPVLMLLTMDIRWECRMWLGFCKFRQLSDLLAPLLDLLGDLTSSSAT